MKKFSQFIIEAKETRASEQAKRLGLVGNGHGDWYNTQGEFVAKTVNGQLKFFNKGQKVGEKDTLKSGAKVAQPVQQPQRQAVNRQGSSKRPVVNKQQEELPGEDEFLTVVFGRFNPPTKEHKKLFSTAQRISLGGEIRVYPSRSQDSNKNPLNPDRKIHYLKIMFPEIDENIVNNPEMRTIFDVLVAANEDGYSNINIVVSSDRLSEMQNLANKHNGKFYQFNEIKVIPTGNFDSDKKSTGISSDLMRKMAAENNFREFKRGMPKTIKEMDAKKLFTELRSAMGLKTSTEENYDLWKISPSLDYKNLRENYIKNKIFNIGDIVENMNTGLIGKIIRRGTNYLICVTENDIMFKSWIKDLKEYNEVEVNSPMRDKKHPNTLVGTLGAFKHYANMTPGAIGVGKKNLQSRGTPYGVNLINKYNYKKLKS